MLKVLLLDIETRPSVVYTWGLFDQSFALNQIVESGSILCWSAKWLGEKDIYFSSIWGDGKKGMLETMWLLLDSADVVCTFNGDSFDLPILNKEFLESGFGPPSPYKKLDLCKISKSKFKFLSNKLDYIVQTLGIGEKLKHYGFDLWKDVMSGNKTAQETMRLYNEKDTELLEELYAYLRPWIVNHPNIPVYDIADNIEEKEQVVDEVDTTSRYCPSCGSENLVNRGKVVTNSAIYQRFRCNSCWSWSRAKQNLVEKDDRKRLLVSL